MSRGENVSFVALCPRFERAVENLTRWQGFSLHFLSTAWPPAYHIEFALALGYSLSKSQNVRPSDNLNQHDWRTGDRLSDLPTPHTHHRLAVDMSDIASLPEPHRCPDP